MKKDQLSLLKKYDVPTPRYTSYPILPAWKGITSSVWHSELRAALSAKNSGLSIYIHVPFCKSLCAFCGCTKMITQDHSLADQFIETLHKEFSYYEEMIADKIQLFEIHLGGGSPSWLTPDELEKLLSPILNSKKIIIDRNTFEQSIEMDPRTTSMEHCRSLAKMGFTRVSLGIQDTNPEVLKSIRREQPLELVAGVVNELRANHLDLLNMDLIYGLPNQTVESIKKTISDILSLKPTRIALYSYAHVPSMKPAQKILERDGLPSPDEKMKIHFTAREMLKEAGYREIGMDHFALPTDALYVADQNNDLHRNFMGYTIQRSNVLLGLGPSSLSDTETAFAQNEKDFRKWREDILQNQYSLINGHKLTEKELYKRKKILELMCEFKTDLTADEITSIQKEKLDELIDDEIISKIGITYQVTSLGKNFIRNVCHAIDDSH